MDSYSAFATVYDELMDNIPYDEWVNYLHSLLQTRGVKKGLVAELGCGTGNVTERMASLGYDMIGIDNSVEMLELARQKQAESGSKSLYLAQDMREFELFGTVDAIISICDSINYITEPKELLEVFRLVNNYLETDGIFVFDFHTRHYYRDVVANATIAEDREDISFIWDNYYDEERSVNELALSLFVAMDEAEKERLPKEFRELTLCKKYEELHLQRGYTLAEMQTLIARSGLILLDSYDAFTTERATEGSERVYMICREHTESGAKRELSDRIHEGLMA